MADEAVKRSLNKRTGVRAPARSYLGASFVGAFFSALSFYLELELLGYCLFAAAAIMVPALALTDNVVFNGKRLYRSGLLPKLWAYITHQRAWLKLRDIEQVETRISPALKRGGRVYFRYRSSVRGNGIEFSFSSGGDGYRELARHLFGSLPEEVLDAGSIELRDYLGDPGCARVKAKQSDIPPADVLEHAFRHSGGRKSFRQRTAGGVDQISQDRASSLRQLGNQLRVSGSLLQAMESFRRAASIRPNDAWLLFDFARCIQAFADAEGKIELERKAAAMLRLAERRAGSDGRLLARLGEIYFQLGDWERAGAAFQKAVGAAGEQYRSIRGLAEIALRNGKLAHVVHNFSAAGRIAETPAVRRWSRAEAEYFSRLNNDAEYLEMELGRVNLLDALERWRGTTFRLCLIGFPVIAAGLYFEDATIANSGWVLSGGMLVLWTAIMLGLRAFTPRIAPDLLGED